MWIDGKTGKMLQSLGGDEDLGFPCVRRLGCCQERAIWILGLKILGVDNGQRARKLWDAGEGVNRSATDRAGADQDRVDICGCGSIGRVDRLGATACEIEGRVVERWWCVLVAQEIGKQMTKGVCGSA